MVVNRRQTRKKIIRKAPLHHRILGKSQVEIDLLEDLTDELEKAYNLDLIEHDDYLDCLQALEVRRERAKKALNKALGRSSPSANTRPAVKRSNYSGSVLDAWGFRLLMILAAIIFFKSL